MDITAGIDCRYVYDSAEYFDIVLHFAAIVGGRATIDGNPLAVAQTIALDVALFNYTQREAAACGLPVIIGGVPHPLPAAPQAMRVYVNSSSTYANPNSLTPCTAG